MFNTERLSERIIEFSHLIEHSRGRKIVAYKTELHADRSVRTEREFWATAVSGPTDSRLVALGNGLVCHLRAARLHSQLACCYSPLADQLHSVSALLFSFKSNRYSLDRK